jgi:predicted phosphoadenosine phosphosulfate sulfurtransferase
MTNNTDSPTEVETGSYLTAYLYRVPKRNHDVITQNLKKFIPWFEKNGVRLEYYNLAGRETQEVVDSSNAAGMEGIESIAKTLAAEDEDIWRSYNTLEITAIVKKCMQR